MKSTPRQASNLKTSEGKGTLGCLLFLVLLGAVVVVAIKAGPVYYSYKSFEADIKTEVSRAGSHFYDDEAVIKDILDLARRNEVRLVRENIKVERFAGQIFVTVRYTVPVDLIITQRNLDFSIKASSFIGRL